MAWQGAGLVVVASLVVVGSLVVVSSIRLTGLVLGIPEEAVTVVVDALWTTIKVVVVVLLRVVVSLIANT